MFFGLKRELRLLVLLLSLARTFIKETNYFLQGSPCTQIDVKVNSLLSLAVNSLLYLTIIIVLQELSCFKMLTVSENNTKKHYLELTSNIT